MSEPRPIRREIQVGAHKLTIETGRVARQASGSLLIQQGGTVVLVTAQAARDPRDVPFLPLTVEYREAMYAAGKIPGGFFKREGRPNEKETLTCRLIDRPLRPLFPEGWNFETQVIALTLSADKEYNPDVLAVTGASFALTLSDIPWDNPIAAVRVGLVDGEYVINPSHAELETSKLDIVVAASADAIVMVEAGAHEASEQEIIGALFAGHEACRPLIDAQHELAREAGKVKREFTPQAVPEDLDRLVHDELAGPLLDAMQIPGKLASYAKVDELLATFIERHAADDPERQAQIKSAFHHLQDELLHDYTLRHRKRIDGRRLDEIRPLTIEVGVLPRTHGSALFTRGETQALVLTTLGTSADTQRIDWLEAEGEKRFMLHYNFPPFSVGEVRFLRGPGRREIGHGALAERALRPVMPPEEKFPYTVRLVSEILESNGSSSMASVCGGSLSMMDAGVPISKAVAGIAMGLVMRDGEYAVLTDILGDEDHLGDMDFKVAGTEDGITSLQMDIKVAGITPEIMEKALAQAKGARMHILDEMNKAISSAGSFSDHAPRIETMQVPTDKIREVIGSGGKVIREIVEVSGAKVDINDDGVIKIASANADSIKKAYDMINSIVAEPEEGKIYRGKVVKIVDFGAFVNFFGKRDGLVHVSQIENRRLNHPSDVLKEGQEVWVKLLGFDDRGKVRLAMKMVDQETGKEITKEEKSDS